MEKVNRAVKPDAPDRESALRPPIDFEQYREQMEDFKVTHIYRTMRSQESKLGVYVHTFPFIEDRG